MAHVIGRQHGGRTSAPMQMRDRVPLQKRADIRDLGEEIVEILLDGRVAVHDRRMAAAEPAERVAERNMQIKRERHSRRQTGKPCAKRLFRYSSMKMWRRRI